MSVYAKSERECKLSAQKCDFISEEKKKKKKRMLIDCVFNNFRLIVRVYQQRQQ